MSAAVSEPKKQNDLCFEDFYNENYSPALFYAVKKMSNFHAAEDLVGEVFVYCYEHFGEYDPEKSSPKTWLYLILNSRLKNYYRDRKIHADWSDLENELYEDDDFMGKAVYLEQLKKQMMDVIGALPEKQQIVVIGRYYREESFAELAKKLDTTEGNVRVILSRAIKKLGELCQDF